MKSGKSSYPLPPGKKLLSARHALQSARIAPKPRPRSPAGLPVSEYLVFCRKVLVRREKLPKVRKIDKHTYTYIYCQGYIIYTWYRIIPIRYYSSTCEYAPGVVFDVVSTVELSIYHAIFITRYVFGMSRHHVVS